MQDETLSIVVTAAATVATALISAATFALGVLNRVSNLKRVKPHVSVALRARHTDMGEGRGYQHGYVRVVNDGQVNVFIEQIGFKFRDSGNTITPVELWNSRADYRRLLAPGDVVDVELNHDMDLIRTYGRPKRAAARLASGVEFRSDVITEKTPGAFTFV